MIETYLKLFQALLAGFAITGVALFIARRLSLQIDRRLKKGKPDTPDQKQDQPNKAAGQNDRDKESCETEKTEPPASGTV